MYKNTTFKKKLIASAVASAALASLSGMAVAQSDDQALEEIVVTGLRASLDRAMDIKRDSTGVVDAISAEDIGKMPDTNLAESLQRVTGVSIDRTNGEGSRVTVRGIDPALNMVTLNGRNMPAVTNDTGDVASRAFDFANLASELVNGVEIYKTGKANITSGGLGAVINVKTMRPLDLGKVVATAGVKAVHDETSTRGAGSHLTPEVSGLYSWVNENESFGVTLAASYQERDNTRSRAFVNQWQLRTAGEPTFDGDDNMLTSDGTLPADADVKNAPQVGQLYNLPTDLRYAVSDINRVRQNAQLTMQFRPVENLTATLDHTYYDNELTTDLSQQSTWYNISAITDLTFDDNEVKTPLVYHEAYPDAGKDVSFAQQAANSRSQTNSTGLNLAWDLDTLSLELDYHHSKAENEALNKEAGLNANIIIGEYSYWGNDFPVMGITIDDSNPRYGNNNGMLDGGDMSGAMGTVAYSEQLTEIDQLRLMGELDLGGLFLFEDSSLQFGLEAREDSNHTISGDGTSPRITMGNWSGVPPTEFGDMWPNFWSPRDFGDAFPDHDNTTNHPRFLDGGVDTDPQRVFDHMEYMHAQAQNAKRIEDPNNPGEMIWDQEWVNPDNFNSMPSGEYKWNHVVQVDRLIEEDVKAAYLQFNGSFDMGGMASNVVLGLRYEETDVTSTSAVAEPEALEWQENNDWAILLSSGTAVPFTRTASYDNLLPNLDFDIAVTDDVKVRASYSKTMGRAAYNELRADVALNNAYLRTANGGNPDLDPMESDNLDLSVEWYYADASYASVGFFRKDVANFIGADTIQANWYGLRDARRGPRFEQAQQNIIADGGDPNDETLQHNEMLRLAGKDPADQSTSVYATANDPLMMWNTNVPVNDQDNVIDGVELAIQHWFGDTGYGFQANYTMVDAEVNYDTNQTGGQFAMLGLSDSANLIGFYDGDRFQARVAYNWRDKYLSSRTASGANEPNFVEEYGQWDANVAYDINENFVLSVEALNITGEDSRVHGRSVNQMYTMEDLGPRYQVGVRWTY